MDLILWRHADAGDAEADAGADLLRPLSAKGVRQAQRVAMWLNHVLPGTTKVLVSPAARAQQTARALERKFKTVTELAPGGTVGALLDAVRWPDSREPVLVVGHQPMLGLAAAYLMAGANVDGDQPSRIRKGGVWWLRRRERDGTPELSVVTVRSPDLL